jgi:hypothetical protein
MVAERTGPTGTIVRIRPGISPRVVSAAVIRAIPRIDIRVIIIATIPRPTIPIVEIIIPVIEIVGVVVLIAIVKIILIIGLRTLGVGPSLILRIYIACRVAVSWIESFFR